MRKIITAFFIWSVTAAFAVGDAITRGGELYRTGDIGRHITACIACHGPTGLGNEAAGFPVVAGQHEKYTVSQLQAFKDKRRTNDYQDIMQSISANMSLEDMSAVASYIAKLHP